MLFCKSAHAAPIHLSALTGTAFSQQQQLQQRVNQQRKKGMHKERACAEAVCSMLGFPGALGMLAVLVWRLLFGAC